MISCLTYSSIRQELAKLECIMKDEAAYVSGEDWNMQFVSCPEQIEVYLKSGKLLDLACVDITSEGMLARVEALRAAYKKALLMVIADAGISPMTYLKPSVMPNSLLLRPAAPCQIQRVVKELFAAFMQEHSSDEAEDVFVLETREGKTFIPYKHILYFEAREKKVFVRVGNAEYALYETLERVKEVLPAVFLRCHRSYIVNTSKIERVVLSRNIIELPGGILVPVSRSYRMDVKNI